MWGGNDEWSSDSECSSVEVDLEPKSTVSYQSGRVEVGSKDDDGEESMRFTIEFNQEFPEVPTVFVCPEGEPGETYGDVFGTTVISETITTTGCDVNIGRMAKGETTGWGQNVHLNWFAVVSNSPMLQTVVAGVGPNDDEEKESIQIKVKFPKKFPEGQRPLVYATAYGQDYPDTFTCCIQRMSSRCVHLSVTRGVGTTWGQYVCVSILATTAFPGWVTTLGANEDDEMDHRYEGLEYPRSPGHKAPVVLTMAQHESKSEYGDCFVCSPADVTNGGFQLNMQRAHPEHNGWGQELRAQTILIP